MNLKLRLFRYIPILAIVALLIPQAQAGTGETAPSAPAAVGGIHVEPAEEGSSDPATVTRRSGGGRDRRTALAPCPAGQHCWYEGGTDAGLTYNCTILGGGYSEPLGRSWVGWRGNIDSSPTQPRTGDVYYTKIGWGVSGFPCGNGGAYVHIELYLPANTQLAITNQNPVQCWYKNLQDQWNNYTSNSICPQSPRNGQQGGLSFSPQSGNYLYPTATGAAWEIFIPVKTTSKLTSGYSATGPCSACVGAAVWMIDGNNSPWSYPRTGVYVDGGPPPPPSVSYPTPSVKNIQYNPDETNWPGLPSYSETYAHIFTEGTSGTGWFEMGKTKEYGTNSSIYNIGNGTWEYWQAWRMEAGETWHWRFCYKPTGQTKICGRDQTFETAPPPDTSNPTTNIKKGPANFARGTANFAFGSNESNVQFWCNLDNQGFNPCASATPTYKNLSEGPHTLGVYARDAAGNTDPTPALWNWTVDLTKPNTSITSGPSGRTSARKATFKFISTEPGTFLCSLDGRRFAKCASPKTYDSLSRGQHTFKVKAKDRAGNIDGTPAVREWRVT